MTRIIRNVGLVLALATAGLCASAFATTAGGTAAAQSGADTPLPPGWELCILAGVTAPATQVNITDLDDWQAAEGGSTNNTAAFNPFNTQRMTDVTGAPIPGAISANGFPAFPSWAGGCSATVATLFQPNMWPITSALRAGNISPGAAFLAVVDQSAWCAPSADGLPCYASSVLGLAGSIPASVPASLALDVYGSVTSALHTYQQAIAKVTADQGELAVRDLALAETQSQVASTRDQLGAASRALRSFAISEYVNSGLYTSAPLVNSGNAQPLTPSTPQNSDGVVAQQYLGVAASNLVTRNDAAAGAVKDSLQRQKAAATVDDEASVALTTDQVAENQALSQLVQDVATLEHAGACTTVTIPAPAPSASANGSTSTTTTTTVPPTTTTVPPTTATTTVPPTTTTTTTTTTVPSTSTTTTTVPPTAAAPSATTATPAEPAGVVALQGCIATFAPPSGT